LKHLGVPKLNKKEINPQEIMKRHGGNKENVNQRKTKTTQFQLTDPTIIDTWNRMEGIKWEEGEYDALVKELFDGVDMSKLDSYST
jgi:hypothetical protein